MWVCMRERAAQDVLPTFSMRHIVAVRTEIARGGAGVAHNKILAKLASGMHKPAQQTVVPLAAVPALLAPLPVGRLRQLGGKFGEQLTHALGITTVGVSCCQFSYATLFFRLLAGR